MFHASTERMIDYWMSRARPGEAPPRASIQPADFRQLMPQVFILGRTALGDYPVRLAGGFVADLHGRDLLAVNALDLWSQNDRAPLQRALEDLRESPEPLVVTAEAITDSETLPLEMLFAPLLGPDGQPDRFLGLYQPLSMVARLMGRHAQRLSLRSMSRPGAANEEAPHLRLAAVDGRQVA